MTKKKHQKNIDAFLLKSPNHIRIYTQSSGKRISSRNIAKSLTQAIGLKTNKSLNWFLRELERPQKKPVMAKPAKKYYVTS